MYELTKQKKMIRTVSGIKKVKKPKRRPLSEDIQELFVDTPVGRVRTLCFGMEKKESEPVFFDMHGGGFVMGTADVDIDFCRYIHEKCRCKVISIEYSKAPEHPYPQAVNEVYEVVRHFVCHAEEYGIDKTRMCIGGHSAGGNLAAVTALKSLKEKEFEFRGQILDYPPLDLSVTPYDKPCPKGAIPPQIAAAFDACYLPDSSYEECPYISPVYSKREDMLGLPDALMIAAGCDSLHDEAVRYYELLLGAGVSARLLEYPEAGHGFTMKEGKDAEDAIEKMAEFLQEHLYVQ
ncbi:MAG: alpha/beta hydrolase [Lachnospiraceae bacterium]|nr:alpha/beta hydrolase [Lachnospiraceae bacterium]